MGGGMMVMNCKWFKEIKVGGREVLPIMLCRQSLE